MMDTGRKRVAPPLSLDALPPALLSEGSIRLCLCVEPGVLGSTSSSSSYIAISDADASITNVEDAEETFDSCPCFAWLDSSLTLITGFPLFHGLFRSTMLLLPDRHDFTKSAVASDIGSTGVPVSEGGLSGFVEA
jgi:hypothetical protein